MVNNNKKGVSWVHFPASRFAIILQLFVQVAWASKYTVKRFLILMKSSLSWRRVTRSGAGKIHSAKMRIWGYFSLYYNILSNECEAVSAILGSRNFGNGDLTVTSDPSIIHKKPAQVKNFEESFTRLSSLICSSRNRQRVTLCWLQAGHQAGLHSEGAVYAGPQPPHHAGER